MPILRSEAQGRILSAIYLSPDSLHLKAIADRAGVPYSVVQREVDRLEDARLVTSVRFASSRVVRPNDAHPLFRELRALLFKAYGPQEVVHEILLDEPGVAEAYIFGSWADRFFGNWGSEWGDIDVALIGEVEPDRAEEVEAEIEDRLGFPAHVVVIDRDGWHTDASPFVKTIKQRPLVPVLVGDL